MQPAYGLTIKASKDQINVTMAKIITRVLFSFVKRDANKKKKKKNAKCDN